MSHSSAPIAAVALSRRGGASHALHWKVDAARAAFVLALDVTDQRELVGRLVAHALGKVLVWILERDAARLDTDRTKARRGLGRRHGDEHQGSILLDDAHELVGD